MATECERWQEDVAESYLGCGDRGPNATKKTRQMAVLKPRPGALHRTALGMTQHEHNLRASVLGRIPAQTEAAR